MFYDLAQPKKYPIMRNAFPKFRKFNYSVKKQFSYHYFVLFLVGSIIISNTAQAQQEEVKQRIAAFEELLKEDYIKKTFNISDRDLGEINKTEPIEVLDYMYKSKEKKKNQYDNMGYEQLFISMYMFEDEFKREIAMEYWFKNFIRGLSIKPGKNVKFYDGAQPTLIMINKDHIIILQAKCKYFSEDSWYLWKKSFIKAFEETKSTLIEIKCDGPLEWGLTIPETKRKK
jgi:hypothetical protein